MPTPPRATPLGNPLPPNVHVKLSAKEIGSGRVIVIGDVHGCSDELHDLLEKCCFKQGKDIAVSVGDLVGKGPNSIQVLRAAQKLGIITVRGNWDEQALANLPKVKSGSLDQKKWRWLKEVTDADAAYIQAMPFSLSIPSHGCIVTHAGLLPGVPLEEQSLIDLIEMRHVDLVDPTEAKVGLSSAERWQALPKYPREAGKPWATVWPGPEHVIFGHHARRRLQECTFASGIDTGCCLGDQLTALVLPTLQSLEAKNWSPPDTGVTRELLGAELISVQARQQYVLPDEE